VRTDYRPYSADEVATIVPAENAIGYAVRQEHITWQPPQGFSLGVDLPALAQAFTPVPFRDGKEHHLSQQFYKLCYV
jgi:hypothetical protein